MTQPPEPKRLCVNCQHYGGDPKCPRDGEMRQRAIDP